MSVSRKISEWDDDTFYDTDEIKQNVENKEESQKTSKVKLPLKSINGRRCLTKCYPKGATYLHPVLLTGVADTVANSCAIDPTHSKDPQYYREYDMILSDKCRLEDNKLSQPPNEIESILLSFYFNPSDFLASIYEINSFDQAIEWTYENPHLPFDTIKRVHNCAWKVFGNKDDLSNVVLEYYYEIAKTHWLHDYVKTIQNRYSFNLISDKNSNISNTSKEIYDIISSRFLTKNFFITTVKKFIYEYQDNWEQIDSYYRLLKHFVFTQLVKDIENEATKK